MSEQEPRITQSDRDFLSYFVILIGAALVCLIGFIGDGWNSSIQWFFLMITIAIFGYLRFYTRLNLENPISRLPEDFQIPKNENMEKKQEQKPEFRFRSSGRLPQSDPDQPSESQAPEPKESEPNEVGVSSYSLHLVPQKYRAMFDDIHSFAISSKKPVHLLRAKVKSYGYSVAEQKKSPNFIAFDFGFLRMPASGYFEVEL